VDNAQQYGKIIRLIIDFDATSVSSSLTSSNLYFEELISGKLRSTGGSSQTLTDHHTKLAQQFYAFQDKLYSKGLIA
jgi:hypothetical protein